jgi:hypothetical protein
MAGLQPPPVPQQLIPVFAGQEHCRYQESEACWLCPATAPRTPAAGNGESRFNEMVPAGRATARSRHIPAHT